MTTINPSPTNRTVRQLRQVAFEALIALHGSDPDVVHELADMLERAAALHSAIAPTVRCRECDVKRSVAALLRSVATLRELVSTPPADGVRS